MDFDTPYYFGSAENKLNIKGQVAIPACFRSVLPADEQNKNYVIIRGKGSCLYMYTPRHFARIVDNARRLAEETDDDDFFADFMAEAVSIVPDPQGRFVLPQHLMKAVDIKGPLILFVGVDERIEIWDPDIYRSSRGARDAFEEKRRNAGRRIFGV